MSDFKKGPKDPGPRLVADVERELALLKLDIEGRHETIKDLEREVEDLQAELTAYDRLEECPRFAFLSNAELVDWFRLGKVEPRDFIALAVARLERT